MIQFSSIQSARESLEVQGREVGESRTKLRPESQEVWFKTQIERRNVFDKQHERREEAGGVCCIDDKKSKGKRKKDV